MQDRLEKYIPRGALTLDRMGGWGKTWGLHLEGGEGGHQNAGLREAGGREDKEGGETLCTACNNEGREDQAGKQASAKEVRGHVWRAGTVVFLC